VCVKFYHWILRKYAHYPSIGCIGEWWFFYTPQSFQFWSRLWLEWNLRYSEQRQRSAIQHVIDTAQHIWGIMCTVPIPLFWVMPSASLCRSSFHKQMGRAPYSSKLWPNFSAAILFSKIFILKPSCTTFWVVCKKNCVRIFLLGATKLLGGRPERSVF